MSKSETYLTNFQKRLQTIDRHVKYFDCKVFELKIDQRHLNESDRNNLHKIFVEGKWFTNSLISKAKESGKPLHSSSYQSKDAKFKTVVHLDKDGNKIESSFDILSASSRQGIVMSLKSNIKSIWSNVKAKNIKLTKDLGLKFKSECVCIPLKQYKTDWAIVSKNRIKITRFSKPFRVHGLNQLDKYQDIEFANAKLLHKPDGFYLNITVWIPKQSESIPNINNHQTLGIDFGCRKTLNVYNLERNQALKINVVYEEPEQLKRTSKLINRRFVKKCSNRSNKGFKLRNKLRKQYQKLTNKKNDSTNKIIHWTKQFKLVCFQDDPLKAWSRKHGKKIQHSILGRIKSKLKNNSNTIVIPCDKNHPTSKMCPICSSKNKELGLKEVFKCECGYQEDRDIHAARNMILFATNKVPMECRDPMRVSVIETASKPVEIVTSIETNQIDLLRQVWSEKQETAVL